MTPLARLLAERITDDGPLPVATVMGEALGHPLHGYYRVQQPFGAEGDFITAPEISQMFGELIGLWLGVAWQAMGAPANAVLVELGPGRGTLMADARRALARVPGFPLGNPVHLVETSQRLRAIQKAAIAGPVSHHDDIDGLPGDVPLLLVANEFFDALPIRQVVWNGRTWHERVVGLDDAGKLAFGLTPDPWRAPLPVHDTPQTGAVLELCPAGAEIAAGLGHRLASQSGVALIIDYGAAHRGFADTLQAVSRHRFTDILPTLGEADLTAHVNFAHLADAASQAGAVPHGPITQGDFLNLLGIEARARRLAQAGPEQADRVASALQRLTHPQEMGSLFKVLALTGPSAPVPPAFEGL